MLTVQNDFGFMSMDNMRALKPMRIKGNGPRLSVEDRDRRIVELRRAGISIKKIAREVRCVDATVKKILARDWPAGLPDARAVSGKDDASPIEDSLALPPTGDEPLASIGVHFWDLKATGQCRFIVARDPDDKMARFCGEATAREGCSWCLAHLAVVAQPQKKFVAEAA